MKNLVAEVTKILGPTKYGTQEGQAIRKLAEKLDELEQKTKRGFENVHFGSTIHGSDGMPKFD